LFTYDGRHIVAAEVNDTVVVNVTRRLLAPGGGGSGSGDGDGGGDGDGRLYIATTTAAAATTTTATAANAVGSKHADRLLSYAHEVAAHRAFFATHTNALLGAYPANVFRGDGRRRRHARIGLNGSLRKKTRSSTTTTTSSTSTTSSSSTTTTTTTKMSNSPYALDNAATTSMTTPTMSTTTPTTSSTTTTTRLSVAQRLPRALRRHHYGHRHMRTLSHVGNPSAPQVGAITLI
jgi:hypothetical protein